MRVEEEEEIKFRTEDIELLCVGKKWNNGKGNSTAVADTNKHTCLC